MATRVLAPVAPEPILTYQQVAERTPKVGPGSDPKPGRSAGVEATFQVE